VTQPELFEQLKQHEEEPNLSGQPWEADGGEEVAYFAPEAILKRLPGITEENCREVMDKVDNLYELTRLTLPELSNIIGPQNAKKLHKFFQQQGGA